jgi:hypothetical protein
MSYQGSPIIQLQYPLFAASPHHVFCLSVILSVAKNLLLQKTRLGAFRFYRGYVSRKYISAPAGRVNKTSEIRSLKQEIISNS